MKKLFFAVLVAASIGTSAFAADATKVNYRVRTAFETEFAGAENVIWTITPEYTRCSFTLNNEKIEAFYRSNGEQIGTSHKVDFDKLPASAIKKIQKNYPEYKVKETIQFEVDGEKNYYVSLENGNLKRILEVSNFGTVSIFHGLK